MNREIMNRETKRHLESIAAKKEQMGGAVRVQVAIRVKSQQLEATAEGKKNAEFIYGHKGTLFREESNLLLLC